MEFISRRIMMLLLVEGMSINAISEKLAISNKTVSTHKVNLMDKLGVGSIADLVRYALQSRLIDR